MLVLRHTRALIPVTLLLAVVVLSSCQQDTPDANPEVVAPQTTPVAQAVTSLPSPTLADIQTPPPTPIPPPPVVVVEQATEVSEFADAPETPSAVSTEESVLSIPDGLIGPENFPPDVNPLTGEQVSDPALLARRPVLVKISNAPAVVRPQSGLNRADLVFEHYAEGGLTRFTALFYGKDSDPIGSIRSGRFIDIELPQMYDAAFAYSGSSGPLQLMFLNGSFFDRVISPDFGHGGFFRVEDPNKAFEHTLFTNSFNLRRILDDRGQNIPPSFKTNMAFSEQPLSPGEAAARIEIRYDGTIATWAYNANSGRYSRWTDGIPHLDANSGEQLNFRNIVIVAAHHEDTDILEDHVGGGHYSIQIQAWGEGPVSIFRDGQRFDGRWRREDPSHMLTFYDLEGNILPLAPGNSFFQFVPLGFDRLNISP